MTQVAKFDLDDMPWCNMMMLQKINRCCSKDIFLFFLFVFLIGDQMSQNKKYRCRTKSKFWFDHAPSDFKSRRCAKRDSRLWWYAIKMFFDDPTSKKKSMLQKKFLCTNQKNMMLLDIDLDVGCRIECDTRICFECGPRRIWCKKICWSTKVIAQDGVSIRSRWCK